MSPETRRVLRTIPVIEIFGPTIQGEGWPAGLPTYFVRLGGCDWRCSWCDSLHAVLPEHVRTAPRRTVVEIVHELDALPNGAAWVTLSGGNPALHDLGELVELLHARNFGVAVETQGSRWKDWLAKVDHLTVSPKPPSSGEVGTRQSIQVENFLSRLYMEGASASLKIVVFDEADLAWALETADAYAWLPFFLSCGTDSQGGESLQDTAERYRWLCEAVASADRPSSRRARVFPQLHVIAWAHRRGV